MCIRDRTYSSKIADCSVTRAIVETVNDLAKRLGLAIIVEGIETDEQRVLIRDMGITHAQGFLMGRPCNEETFLNHYTLFADGPGLATEAKALVTASET